MDIDIYKGVFMSDENLVSIILVTYNSSGTVIDTLNSIKEQTYRMLELIITDDSSTDDTINVVKTWLAKNKSRFNSVKILVAKKNHGVVKNCNIGFSAAKGRYVQFVSGDDILFRDAIEKKVKFADANKLGVVYCKVRVVGNDKKIVDTMKSFCNNGYGIIKSGRKAQWKEIIKSNFIAGPSGAFYLKEFFINQGMYNCKYPMLEDYPFIFRYIKEGNEIVLLDEELVYYRITESSLCTSGNYRFIKSNFLFFLIERLPLMLKMRMFNSIAYEFKFHIYYIAYHFFPDVINCYEKIKKRKLLEKDIS